MRKADVIFVGKRKTSVAKVFFRPGKGNVFINKTPVELFNEFFRSKVLTPLRLLPEFWSKHDFHVTVRGGGVVSSAEAVAIAISKAAASQSEQNRQTLLNYDRHLLIDDPRRTEPKKPMRRSARRFRQKSYR
ncbi:MAG: 30S ribosomal protein S9 [Candidatus Caldarchaeum sp.]|nr:30S ribosomal protein S9 [Candidatus Caldarchaeum sp.]MCS7134013.1 30S ribosomal protein S9 [Candidatus Caldarchaeum sp.]MCX8201371.1 30S ribosomal protein S9 [Candidatus Caldarchaeum sp.]MDW8062918.1 30S ribosomal protein S9 [Candidatus Caldarchaeum sp.]MDW8435584.1 30S ribosomal protein S9 [Candidatus Caldarchaeum sp.]